MTKDRKLKALLVLVVVCTLPEVLGRPLSSDLLESLAWFFGIFCGGNGVEWASKSFVVLKSGKELDKTP